MSDNIRNSPATADDEALAQAELQLADPHALNMQFLQSSLSNLPGLEQGGAGSQSASARDSFFSIPNPSATTSGLTTTPPIAGMLGALTASNLGAASGAIGLAAQAASAAPGTFGKSQVGDSANLAGLGNRALAQGADAAKGSEPAQALKMLAGAEGDAAPMSAELAQLLAMLESPTSELDNEAILNSLVDNLGSNPSAESLDAAIDAVLDQISLLNSSFEPVFENLASEVQSEVIQQQDLSSTDLSLSILDDAGAVSSSLADLLGNAAADAGSQLQGLLNLGNTFDGITSLLPPLPGLDISPVIDPVIDIVDGVIGGVTDPVTDIVDGVIGGITDPVIDIVDGVIGGVTDPVTDIVDGVIGGVTDPVTDIVDGVLGGVTDPVTDIVDGVVGGVLGGVTDPVIDTIGLLSGSVSSSGTESDAGLLGSLSSGISSTAGSDSGLLGGALDSLDPLK